MNDFKRAVMDRCSSMPCPWDQETLAFVLGMDSSRLSKILGMAALRDPNRFIPFAVNLAAAIGETADYWCDLHTSLLLRELESDPKWQIRSEEIRERAKNWKPGAITQKPQSEDYKDGYDAGYTAGWRACDEMQ